MKRKEKQQIIYLLPSAICIMLGMIIIPLFVNPISDAIFGLAMVYFGIKTLELSIKEEIICG